MRTPGRGTGCCTTCTVRGAGVSAMLPVQLEPALAHRSPADLLRETRRTATHRPCRLQALGAGNRRADSPAARGGSELLSTLPMRARADHAGARRWDEAGWRSSAQLSTHCQHATSDQPSPRMAGGLPATAARGSGSQERASVLERARGRLFSSRLRGGVPCRSARPWARRRTTVNDHRNSPVVITGVPHLVGPALGSLSPGAK